MNDNHKEALDKASKFVKAFAWATAKGVKEAAKKVAEKSSEVSSKVISEYEAAKAAEAAKIIEESKAKDSTK